MKQTKASGLQALELATRLLQRARLADPLAGLWEAADVQWWWRRPAHSDDRPQRFWSDDDGPVAAVLATEFRGVWQIDPLIVPGAPVPYAVVWERVLETIGELAAAQVAVPVRDDDPELAALARAAGLAPVERSGVTWMDAAERPAADLPDGFAIVDRTAAGRLHPMRGRNGDGVEDRLRRCSLYDPELDLAVETEDGEVAGYSLYWFDPVTMVGLLEPMRVEDAFRRRGLARAMIAEGLARLAARGATRMKVGYSWDGARALYTGAGFHPGATSTWFGRA